MRGRRLPVLLKQAAQPGLTKEIALYSRTPFSVI